MEEEGGKGEGGRERENEMNIIIKTNFKETAKIIICGLVILLLWSNGGKYSRTVVVYFRF